MTTFDGQIQTLWGDFAQQRLQALADRYTVYELACEQASAP